MSTPKPGQIRCPTCHGSTPPASFCTQCGAPIPTNARTRPRGFDRDELEERLRARRPEDVPYRRGAVSGEAPDGGHPHPFQPFEPEPEDAFARHESADEPPRHIDNLPPQYDASAYDAPRHDEPAYEPPRYEPPRHDQPGDEPRWPDRDLRHDEPRTSEPPPVAPLPPTAAPGVGDQPRYEEPRYAEQRYAQAPAEEPSPLPDDDEYLDDYDYPYDDPGYDEPRRSGGGPLMLVGFAALGLAALFAGVLLSGLFGPGAGVAADSPTPSATASVAAEATPTAGAASPAASDGATSSDGPPVAFDDGFTAEAQPCADEPDSKDGCESSGAQIAAGDKLWVWIGFTKGTNDDVLGITLVDTASGEAVADASYELAKLQAQADRFNGWLKFPFSGLVDGSYQIRVSRNGAPAAEAPFTVGG
jgi:hypothetical protein